MPSGGQNKIDLSGQRFGKLVVLKEAPASIRNLAMWECLCDCGNKIIISGYYLRQGRRKSCGCQNNRHCGKSNPKWTGYEEISGSYWHRVKQGAKSRELVLEITIRDAWDLYCKQQGKCALSGRQLTISGSDKKWRNDLKTQTASLDRIDSSKGYTMENVQWVHKDINRIKMDLELDYFIQLCKEVANHNA